MIKLFVGLGNPGAEYEHTRHNAGFWWLDALAAESKTRLMVDRSYWAQMARCTLQGNTVWLLAPQTFMNASGKSVAALARFFKIAPNEILVAHDEHDIAPGEAKLKLGGSHAGAVDLNGFQDLQTGIDQIAQHGADGATRMHPRAQAVRVGDGEEAAPERKEILAPAGGAEHQALLAGEVVAETEEVGVALGGRGEAAIVILEEGADAGDERLNQVGARGDVHQAGFHAAEVHNAAEDGRPIRADEAGDVGMARGPVRGGEEFRPCEGFPADAGVVEEVGGGPGISLYLGDGVDVRERAFDAFKVGFNAIPGAPDVAGDGAIRIDGLDVGRGLLRGGADVGNLAPANVCRKGAQEGFVGLADDAEAAAQLGFQTGIDVVAKDIGGNGPDFLTGDGGENAVTSSLGSHGQGPPVRIE